MKEDMKKGIDEKDLMMAERFKAVKVEELKEAKGWIEKGKVGAKWYWGSEEKQESSLESSYEFFLTRTDQRSDDAIIHFVGQEIYDLWNGYKDDSLSNRCNHAKALYDYITNKVSKP